MEGLILMDVVNALKARLDGAKISIDDNTLIATFNLRGHKFSTRFFGDGLSETIDHSTERKFQFDDHVGKDFLKHLISFYEL